MNTEVKLVNDNDIADLINKIKMASSKIMISSYTKIIGVVLYRFKLKIDDNHAILGNLGLACVCWRKEEGDLTVVPNIWFSPLLHSWSVQEIAFVIMHEILHVLDLHQNRKGTRHHILWNLACDHIINRRLIQDISNGNNQLQKPEQIFIIDEWMDRDLCAEEVYDMLLDEAEKGEIIINTNGEDGEDGEDGIEGDGNGTVTRNGKTFRLNPDLDSNEKRDDKEIKNEVKNISSIIRGALQSEVFNSNRGNQSGGITEYLEDIVEIKIPWEKLLEKAIHKLIPIKSDNRSWRVINKRMLSHNLLLPYSEAEMKNESNLYIVIDNSGSITSDDLSAFASIILNSAGFFNDIVIFKHDIEVQEILEFKEGQGMDNLKEIIKGVGRGGTSHEPVFDEIEKRIVGSDDPDEVGLVIMLTDYISDVEQIWNNYKWVEEIPVKVILTCSSSVASFVDDSPIEISKVDK